MLLTDVIQVTLAAHLTWRARQAISNRIKVCYIRRSNALNKICIIIIKINKKRFFYLDHLKNLWN